MSKYMPQGKANNLVKAYRSAIFQITKMRAELDILRSEFDLLGLTGYFPEVEQIEKDLNALRSAEMTEYIWLNIISDHPRVLSLPDESQKAAVDFIADTYGLHGNGLALSKKAVIRIVRRIDDEWTAICNELRMIGLEVEA